MEIFIPDRVYFKIFDKRFEESTHIYGKYRSPEPIKQQEAHHNCIAVKNNLDASQLLIMKQVHGTNIIDVDSITDYTHEPEADGAVTTLRNIAIGIQTADCVPILLADKKARVIGGAHCGWKGAKANIVECLVKAMHQKGATDICAVIGPAIQQASYEVDEIFLKNFLDATIPCEDLFIPSKNPQRYMFDLPKYVRRQLEAAGIKIFKHIQEDTYQNPHKYHSYRHYCHTHQQCGPVNMLSTIVIKN